MKILVIFTLMSLSGLVVKDKIKEDIFKVKLYFNVLKSFKSLVLLTIKMSSG